jgi:TolB-like protein/tRNA A-37 threonylcarbamoyl transferase component Bud32
VALAILEELREALREQYAVESEVGRGGMATVFVAEDLKHGRRVAIKVLSPELSSSMDGDRFKREIQIAARLSHPHILPVFDSGDANGLLYYVMPFVEGESLRGKLKRETQLPIEDAIAITCEVADALSYAHSFGVVHRDIKPENILLQGGHAVVADFGIARVIQDAGAEKLTQTGMSVGTAAYMSPEQFSGEHIDGRSDMYSLACVLYEMLVGEVPFTGPNAIAIMARHTMELPPSIQIVRGTVPDELEGAIMHALEKVPADRFATVAQFKEAVLGQGATSTYARRTRAYTKEIRGTRGFTPVRRRRRTLVLGAAGMVLLGVATLAARYFWHPGGPFVTQAGNLARDLSANRIAVLYFENDTRDSTLDHVATGLTESLISQLGQVEGLEPISAGGVALFQKSSVTIDSIARTLKVGTLVRGDIREDAGKLRVSVQLVDASGAQFQRASFIVPRGAYLSARDSLAGVVSDLLRQRLGDEIRLREQRSGTQNVDAWALLQRGEILQRESERLQETGDTVGAAQRYAIADSLAASAASLDPQWAQPLVTRAAIADARARMTKDASAIRRTVDSGLVHVSRALALDPRNASALEMRARLTFDPVDAGQVRNQREIDQLLDRAEHDLRDALTFSPRLATAWQALSTIEFAKKNVVEAMVAARKAYETDAYLRSAPAILRDMFWTSYNLEQFTDAIHWCDEGHRRFPNNPTFVRCRLYLLFTKAVTPNPDEAWRAVRELERISPKATWEFRRREAEIITSIVLYRANFSDSAHRVLSRTEAGPDIDPRGDLVPMRALAHEFFGETDQSITLIEQALATHPEHRAGFGRMNAWWWRDLQNNPRFKTLIASGS